MQHCSEYLSLLCLAPKRLATWVIIYKWICCFISFFFFKFSFSRYFKASGPLAVLTCSIIANIIWTKIDAYQYKELGLNQDECEKAIKADTKIMSNKFSQLWYVVFLPMLYALIGNEIDRTKINPSEIGLSVAAILAALLVRMLASFGSVLFNKYDLKEKLFLCIAWIPKATIQVI